MCLAGGNLGVLAFSAYMALGTASSASAEAMFMGLGLPGRGWSDFCSGNVLSE